MRRFWLLALALALGALAGPAGAQTDLSTARWLTLRNGLRVLLAPDTTATGVDVGLWHDAGLRTEPPQRSGLTFLVERLLARNIPGLDGRLRALRAEGGAASAFTTPDASGFAVAVPPPALEAALSLLAARLAEPAITPAALAAEREAIRAERPRRPDASPNGRGVRRLFALLYPGHPYRFPIAGEEGDLERATVADVSAYWRARFGPAGALVTVVGRFDADEAERALAASLERVARHGTPSAGVAARPGAGGARLEETVDFELPLLFAGWRAPGAAAPEAPALDVLSRLLTAGASGRLMQALVPHQGGVFVQGGYDDRRDAGLFYAVVAMVPGSDSTKLEQELIAEVERLAREPVSGEELERARRQAESNLLLGWQSARGRAQALGTAQMVDGDWRAAWSRLAALRALTSADLQRAAAAVLVPERRAVVWLRPGAGRVAAGGGGR